LGPEGWAKNVVSRSRGGDLFRSGS